VRRIAPLLCVVTLLVAPVQAAGSYTPKAGSPERKAILDGVRGDPRIKFTVKVLRVFRHKDPRKGAIAFLDADNGVTGNVRYLIVRTGKSGWKSVWGEGDGGSSGCAVAIRHYDWAMRLIGSYGARPSEFAPEMQKSLAKMRRVERETPGTDCAGDLEGGPDTVIPAPKPR
jgi:hypothetical protein